MTFWLIMLICVLALPIVMMLGGWMMWKHTPKRINAWYGYRTARSMRNRETWKFAHDVCGRLWCKWGLVMFLPAGVLLGLLYGKEQDLVAICALVLMALEFAVLAGTLCFTERALKGMFREDGTRK